MDNYQYVVNWVQQRQGSTPRPLKVLDYGCGQGATVKMLRDRGIEAYGCDAFVQIGKAPRDYVSNPDWFGSVLKDMPEGRIPFAADSFDVVVSNQVIEHVENIELTLSEMHRVLRPGGVVFSVFPHKSVWREGHCGVAFLHWFPKRSRLRFYYATACRAVGFGYHKDKLGSIGAWARNRCQYIDEQTFYRTLPEIHRQFGRYFRNVRHWEASYLRERLGARARFLRPIPDPILVAAVRAGAGCVFSCQKAVSPG
jgi:SAM-dependent methyltransferase